MEKVNIPDFFAFVEELIKFYDEHLSIEEFNTLLQSMVSRLKVEVEDTRANGFKTNMAIQKIWDLVNVLTTIKHVEGNKDNLALFEQTMQPAFEFITVASSIEFDDNIL